MRLANRLEKIARTSRGDGLCACPRAFELRYYPGEDSQEDARRDKTPPQNCPACGRPKLILKIVYEKKWGASA